MTRLRATFLAVPSRVWTVVGGLAVLASAAVSVVLAAGLHVWGGAVRNPQAVAPPRALSPVPDTGTVTVPTTPGGGGHSPAGRGPAPAPGVPVPPGPGALAGGGAGGPATGATGGVSAPGLPGADRTPSPAAPGRSGEAAGHSALSRLLGAGLPGTSAQEQRGPAGSADLLDLRRLLAIEGGAGRVRPAHPHHHGGADRSGARHHRHGVRHHRHGHGSPGR